MNKANAKTAGVTANGGVATACAITDVVTSMTCGIFIDDSTLVVFGHQSTEWFEKKYICRMPI
jgi:hypothetical protein